MIVGIHQPNFAPWIGFFCKIIRSDRFVILDDVQYVRRGFMNRNRINTSDGPQWLTVPVLSKGNFTGRFNEMALCWDRPWPEKHLRALEWNYRRAPYFDDVMNRVVAPVYRDAPQARPNLCDFNTALIRRICDYLSIDTKVSFSSECPVTTTSTIRLVELVRAVGGTAYLSGRGGDKYQNPQAFADVGITLLYNDFSHPVYEQIGNGFEPRLSVLDLLFCCGPSATERIREAADLDHARLVDQKPEPATRASVFSVNTCEV